MKKTKLTTCVTDEVLVFKVVKPISVISVGDISSKSLRNLNIERFKIRSSQKVTNKRIREIEERHQKWAKP